MKVDELTTKLATRDERRLVVKLGAIQIAKDASAISVDGQDFFLDEQATAMFAKYLKIPGPYIKNCPPEFRAQTFEFWRDKHAEAVTVLEVVAGDLVSIHAHGLLMLPLDAVVDVITRVFPPTADVRTFMRDERRLHIDITSDRYLVDIPNPNGVAGRPENGDLTSAGVRVLVYPNQVKAPIAATYLHRHHNNGGMTTDLKEGQITLKGRTVDEVLEGMEVAANEILTTLDDQLARYAKTVETDVPGTPLAFAMALAREAKLPVSVRESVMDLVNQLPEDASVYDVKQAFVTVASRGVKYNTQLVLQELGGRLAMDTQRAIERCSSCEQLLAS
ncbi:hypothetical protein SEA_PHRAPPUCCINO_134 [Mycobacterium phage Phrappuccino]|uniref:Uncharacterized protein n=1 Tax=Mycobacterium phage Phrappuccino TaxID=2591223 RepID=A0A514DDW8_9CAUD|nr:hypothetical protein KHQ87_gp134 [Mycobacterium phage Phrappuccino]QDH91809.1 hypothetical protein SEA_PHRAPPUCCINO_134 [Mycobacterium phage Phrappuccino]QIQ63251.1 hypothetical protein SEA_SETTECANDELA_134 [Mycobacterium phage Settecandela]